MTPPITQGRGRWGVGGGGGWRGERRGKEGEGVGRAARSVKMKTAAVHGVCEIRLH